MSKMDSFMNISLLTTISRKVTSFSDISAVNLMLGWNLFRFVVSALAMKILTNDTAILVPMAVPCVLR